MTAEKELTKFGSAVDKLGRNKAIYAVAAIAVAKGILRPLFTMMDEKQPLESREYAALREGVTEIVAVPSYIGLNWAAEKLGKPLSFDRKNLATIDGVKSNLSFLSVCITATFVIPYLCNKLLPHAMGAYQKLRYGNKKDGANQLDVKETAVEAPKTIAIYPKINNELFGKFMQSRTSSTGMRV